MCSQAVLEYVQSILQIVQSWPLCRVEEWEVWELYLTHCLPLLLLLTITSFTYHFSILPVTSVGREGKVNLTHYYFYLPLLLLQIVQNWPLCRVEERGSLSYPLLPAGITPENYFRQAPSGNQLILIPTHKVIHIS